MSAGAPGTTTPPPTHRTAWTRNLSAPVRNLLSTQTGGAVAVLGAVIVALLWANSPWGDSYESVWRTTLSVTLGDAGIDLDLRDWVNEGLMTFFFLVVGLEAKRELDLGELRDRRRLTLPALAAIGGAIVPVLIYLVFNAGGAGAGGWGAAVSTDTAFALGVLAVAAPGGTRLRVSMLTFSVVDDLTALAVIVFAYSERVDVLPLAIAVGLFAVLLALRWVPGLWRRRIAVLLGVGIWVGLLESGIDAVIAGLAVGLVTAAYPPSRTDLEQVTELTRSFREQPTPELARTAQLGVASAISANDLMQYRLLPWTSFVIVPLFALANAGIHVDGDLLRAALTSPITLGIVAGYLVGKPLGVLVAIALSTRAGIARRALSWPAIGGLGSVAGIGFTVALLVSSRAFEGRALEEAKLGVLAAALLGSAVAAIVFRVVRRLPLEVRTGAGGGVGDPLVDLAEDIDVRRDHVRGPEAARVTLVEYGDYQCPYCGQAEIVIRSLLGSFGDDLRYVWRHLPLNDVHQFAQLAAEAAEAASAQGAFWPMHDTLFAHQDALEPRALLGYADDLGLDAARFRRDLREHAHTPRVTEDVASADESGVAGTPTFFINGRRHAGAYDVAGLTAAVEAARQRALLAEAPRDAANV